MDGISPLDSDKNSSMIHDNMDNDSELSRELVSKSCMELSMAL